MISIIVPVYNASRTVERCVESILNQSYRDFELILVNDGSKDNSYELMKRMIENDSRVVIINQKNQGVSSARNRGLDEAKGDYILFIDSDDYVDDDYIMTLQANCIDVDWVLSGIRDFAWNREDNLFIYENKDYNLKDENSYLTFVNYGLFNAPFPKLYKHSIIEKKQIRFNMAISLAEDRQFNLEYLKCVNRVRTLSYIGYNYKSDTPGSLAKRDPGNFLKIDYSHWLLEKENIELRNFTSILSKTYLVNKLYHIVNDFIAKGTLSLELPTNSMTRELKTIDYKYLNANRKLINDPIWLRKFLILNKQISLLSYIYECFNKKYIY